MSDEIDEEKIWECMCELTARKTGLSVERVKAIMADNGFHAYGHGGIVEMVELSSRGP